MNGRSRLFARDEDALRALRAAVNARNVIAVERLLIQGAEIPSLDTTALYIAARLGDFEAASLLIENGVELNRRNNQGQTPLFQAAAQGNANLCELLAFRGADVNIRNFLRWHAAHVAQPNVLPILSLFGGNLDSEKVNGRTPLMAAISKGNIEAVDVLLQLNVDVNKTDKFGWTTAQVTNPDVRRLLDEFAQRTPAERAMRKEDLLKRVSDGVGIRLMRFAQRDIIGICLAMSPLELPHYVMLWIIDWLPNYHRLSHLKKIRLIESVHTSVRKLKKPK